MTIDLDSLRRFRDGSGEEYEIVGMRQAFWVQPTAGGQAFLVDGETIRKLMSLRLEPPTEEPLP